MNVVLSPEMERFVQEKVKTGQFRSPSEVIDSALTVLKESESLTPEALEELRQELRSGIEQLDRGEGQPWDLEALKTRVRQNVERGKGSR